LYHSEEQGKSVEGNIVNFNRNRHQIKGLGSNEAFFVPIDCKTLRKIDTILFRAVKSKNIQLLLLYLTEEFHSP
jgi:hypothetical protein